MYEPEKQRVYSLLTTELGFARTIDGALEREAEERALEARQQTGLGPPYPQITHGTHASRLARLGVVYPPYLTPEIATWNLQYHDPVAAAVYGWLNSAPHRNILDDTKYDFWGLGIYTEFPEGETAELQRRWWFLMWLSNEPVQGVTPAQPSEIISPTKLVAFPAGNYWGYKFGSNGVVLSKKPLTLPSGSSASANGRGQIPNRAGVWLRMANGHFTDHWVKEERFVAKSNEPELT